MTIKSDAGNSISLLNGKVREDLNAIMLKKKVEMDQQTDTSISNAVSFHRSSVYPVENVGKNIDVTA